MKSNFRGWILVWDSRSQFCDANFWRLWLKISTYSVEDLRPQYLRPGSSAYITFVNFKSKKNLHAIKVLGRISVWDLGPGKLDLIWKSEIFQKKFLTCSEVSTRFRNEGPGFGARAKNSTSKFNCMQEFLYLLNFSSKKCLVDMVTFNKF